MKTPMDIIFEKADMRCTICNKSARIGCGCWTECNCGWSFQKGTQCRNHAFHAKDYKQPRNLMGEDQ